MSAGLSIQINGQPKTFAAPDDPPNLASLIEVLNLKADRIAVELNGEIAPKATWSDTPIANGDKLEIVHFVGGGI